MIHKTDIPESILQNWEESLNAKNFPIMVYQVLLKTFKEKGYPKKFNEKSVARIPTNGMFFFDDFLKSLDLICDYIMCADSIKGCVALQVKEEQFKVFKKPNVLCLFGASNLSVNELFRLTRIIISRSVQEHAVTIIVTDPETKPKLINTIAKTLGIPKEYWLNKEKV